MVQANPNARREREREKKEKGEREEERKAKDGKIKKCGSMAKCTCSNISRYHD